MSLIAICTSCGAKLRAPDKAAGRTFKCPKCGKPVTVTAITQRPSPFPMKPSVPPTIHYSCPRCKKSLESPGKHAGQKLNCPDCGQRLQIPQPSTPPPAPAINKTVLATEEPVVASAPTPQPTMPAASVDAPPPAASAPATLSVKQPSHFIHGSEIAACAAGIGLLLLTLSPFFRWVNFGSEGAMGLSLTDGKTIFGITIAAVVALITAMARPKWSTPIILGVQAWGTLAAFWLGALVFRTYSFHDDLAKMNDNPFASLIVQVINPSPGVGLHLGLIGGMVVAGSLGFLAVCRLLASGSCLPYYISQAVSCAVGIMLALSLNPTRLSKSEELTGIERSGPSKRDELSSSVQELRDRAAAQEAWRRTYHVSAVQWYEMITNFKARNRPKVVTEADWWEVAKDKTPDELNKLYPPPSPLPNRSKPDDSRDWYRAELYSGFLSPSRELELFDHNKLDVSVIIRTEPGVPTKEVHGHLVIIKKGEILYETQIAKKSDVSFVDHLFVRLKVPYDDANAKHRALRFAKDGELKVVFTVSKAILADGTVKTFAVDPPSESRPRQSPSTCAGQSALPTDEERFRVGIPR